MHLPDINLLRAVSKRAEESRWSAERLAQDLEYRRRASGTVASLVSWLGPIKK